MWRASPPQPHISGCIGRKASTERACSIPGVWCRPLRARTSYANGVIANCRVELLIEVLLAAVGDQQGYGFDRDAVTDERRCPTRPIRVRHWPTDNPMSQRKTAQ